MSTSSPFPHGVLLPNGLHTDPPLLPNDPTIGSMLNHLCLRVRDPEKSLHFYIDLMGMRTVFITNIGPATVYFLGFPQTERHRENLETFGKETAIPTTQGLLELFHIHGSERQAEGYYQSGNDPPNLGFCHLGFSVPDVAGTLQRLRDDGVSVFKDLGECTRESFPITDWENEQGVGVELVGTESEIHADFKNIFGNFAYVKDPDGYFVELIPQSFG